MSENQFRRVSLIVVGALFCGTSLFAQDNWNGFDYADALVPPKEILWGGVPRDGIPAIHNPIFVEAAEADFLSDSDRVLGLTRLTSNIDLQNNLLRALLSADR